MKGLAPVYLDHHATTPLDKRVLEKMLPYFSEIYGNPSSTDHIHGVKAQEAVQKARKTIANILGCRNPNEIVFTSGATESNNLALVGVYRKHKEKGNHIITSAIEHPSVLGALENLRTEGAEISLVPVDQYGTIDLEHLKRTIRKQTILISVMFANNEIGTIQPISEIGNIAKAAGVFFHTDAAQAVGHLKIDMYQLNIDLLSFSGHKFYGPKGIGGLAVRSHIPYINLSPIIHGGGQERNMRSGTLNVPGIVGVSEALLVASAEMSKENKRLAAMIGHVFSQVKQSIPKIKLNGHPSLRLAHNLNVTIPGVEAKALINLLKDKLSFSASSACATVKVQPSHVLKAIGLSDEETFQTIRLGFGRDTEEDDIAEVLIGGIQQLSVS